MKANFRNANSVQQPGTRPYSRLDIIHGRVYANSSRTRNTRRPLMITAINSARREQGARRAPDRNELRSTHRGEFNCDEARSVSLAVFERMVTGTSAAPWWTRRHAGQSAAKSSVERYQPSLITPIFEETFWRNGLRCEREGTLRPPEEVSLCYVDKIGAGWAMSVPDKKGVLLFWFGKCSLV